MANVNKHCVVLVSVALMWVPFDKKKLKKNDIKLTPQLILIFCYFYKAGPTI